MKTLELKYGCHISVTHVSGLRMIAQGTDGVSRGQWNEGVTSGLKMLSFCPWGKTALEVAPRLKTWLTSWLPDKVEFLEPADWFHRGHDLRGGQMDSRGFWRNEVRHGCFVWVPAPSAAIVAFEELRKARLKRQRSLHVIVLPKLMTPEWLKQLYKFSDIIMAVPARLDCWGSENFEPLMIAIVFPFLAHRPWELRNTPKMFAVARKLRSMFQETDVVAGNFLRKFLLEIGGLPSLREDVVRSMLYFEPRGQVSREDSSGQYGGGRKRSQRDGEIETCMGKKASRQKRV